MTETTKTAPAKKTEVTATAEEKPRTTPQVTDHDRAMVALERNPEAHSKRVAAEARRRG